MPPENNGDASSSNGNEPLPSSFQAAETMVLDRLKGEEKKPSPAADQPSEPESTDESVKSDKLDSQPSADIDEQTLKDIREGKIIPKYRFDEVGKKNEELTRILEQYKSFGSPEQLQKILSLMDQRTQAPEKEAPSEPQLDEDEKAMKNMLLRIFPQLSGKGDERVEQLVQELGPMREFLAQQYQQGKQQYESFIDKANDSIRTYAKEYGLNVDDPKNFAILSTAIAQMIEGDENTNKQFYQNRDLAAVKTAFDDYVKRFLSGVQRKTASDILSDKKKTEKLPKAVVSGGPTEPEKGLDPKKFKNFSDTQHIGIELLGK